MTRLFIIAIVILFSTNSHAQLNWVYNMKEAQVRSLNENKLILLDFWASWCAPCRKMDNDLWNNPKIATVANKFIAFKVDVDLNRDLALKYGIKGIPTVLLITTNGDIVWKKSNFSTAKTYLDFFKTLPNNITVLNEALTPILANKKNGQTYLNLGLAYQEMGIRLDNIKLKNAFLKLSNIYFKQANKKENAEEFSNKIALLNILNEAYKGNIKKARKKLSKANNLKLSPSLIEMQEFIIAYCYKYEGDISQLASSKEKITDEHYLAQLED